MNPPEIAFNSAWETDRNWSRFVVPHYTAPHNSSTSWISPFQVLLTLRNPAVLQNVSFHPCVPNTQFWEPAFAEPVGRWLQIVLVWSRMFKYFFISCWITGLTWLELSPNTFRLESMSSGPLCVFLSLRGLFIVCLKPLISIEKQRRSPQCHPPCFNIGSSCFLICTSDNPRSDFLDFKEIRCNESHKKSSDVANLKKNVQRKGDDVLHIPGINSY